eukprot:123567-Pleurochrysis_carterae.AAC.1
MDFLGCTRLFLKRAEEVIRKPTPATLSPPSPLQRQIRMLDIDVRSKEEHRNKTAGNTSTAYEGDADDKRNEALLCSLPKG